MSLRRACKLLGISRQAVYQREKRIEQRSTELAPVKDLVLALRRFMPRLGGRKLYFLLKPKLDEQGIKLGRDGFFNYLRDHRLLVQPVKRYTKTTHSKHWMKKHPKVFTTSLWSQMPIVEKSWAMKSVMICELRASSKRCVEPPGSERHVDRCYTIPIEAYNTAQRSTKRS